jgi:flagellar M-ring protein FliF
MEFAKRMWSQIGAQLEGVALITKALIAALVVILVMAASLLMLYAGEEEMAPVGIAGANSAAAIAQLGSAGIEAKVVNGMIRVPTDSQHQAYLLLAQGDLLGENPASMMDRMFENSSPWETDKSRSERANTARSRFLSGVLANITRIRSADVMVDLGQDGIGKRHVSASAMVNVKTTSGAVDTEMADAIAALVSGAVARLDMTQVKIVDARTGKRVDVSDPSNMLPSNALEVKRNIEERKRKEIENILDYIPDVRVGVNVLMDSVASRHERLMEYEKSQLLQSESVEETVSKDIVDAGEPGPRSNTGLSINGSGGAGSEQTSNITMTEFFDDKPIVLQQEITHTGHQIKQINVAVNVPRSFFVGLYKRQNPDTQDEPDDAALAPLVSPQLAMIEQKIQVLTLTDVQGTVQADMVPDVPSLMIAGSAGAIGEMFESGWAGPAGVTLLALASLGLMLGMVRKATRPESLPSIEELAGVPPSLPSDEELIGEAEESETTMQGVELDENDLRARRVAEQISDMIRADPGEASRLLGKWVSVND